jgi:hypothetical protein
MNLFWQIKVVMLNQIVFLAVRRLACTSTTGSIFAMTSLSIARHSVGDI